MASYNKFEDFVEQLGKGVHQLHAAGHLLEVYASNAAPVATNTIKGDIAEISIANGYPGGSDITNTYVEASGTGTLDGTNVVWTASGGSFGPLRYVVLFNEDATSPADALIAWWDYGSSETVLDTETFTVNITTTLFTLT